jgi:hypothetical protein
MRVVFAKVGVVLAGMGMSGVGMGFGRAALFKRIERLFVGVITLCQLGFIEVIRRIVVAEVRVFEDIFFGGESRITGIGLVEGFGYLAGFGRRLVWVFCF